MKVKIGETLFNSETTPIMIILSEDDKENISNMAPEAFKYCSFSDKELDVKKIQRWMKTE